MEPSDQRNIANSPGQSDYTLDELISLINYAEPSKKYLPPLIEAQPYLKVKKISEPGSTANSNLCAALNSDANKMVKPKTLVFKPWSGIATTSCMVSELNADNNSQPIREEIEAEEQSQEDDQRDKQDYIEDNKTDINTKVANYKKSGTPQEINGYFYRFQNGKVKLIKCLLDQNGFKDVPSAGNCNWTIYWSSCAIKFEVYHGLLPYQKINHFPNSFHITRKDLMNQVISKMQAKFGITHYNFLPKTYILPLELSQLITEYDRHPQQQTYIVKPHNRSQGKGITVTASLDVIYSKLQKYSSLIVSHYIDNPLLINRLKFDLRIYVAVTGVNPLRIYIYEQGLARFATEQYDLSQTNTEQKKYQHLTNYSINKKNTEYISNSKETEEYYGSKWSLTSLKDFLAFNISKHQVQEVFQRIDDILVKTILAAQNILFTAFNNNVPYVNSCFQVFGFDIMIDSNLKPWLIEVNLSPSMNTDSVLDLKIKGNMIADLFTMIGVVPVGERYLYGGHSKYETSHYIRPDDVRREQSAADKFLIKEVELENQRSGGWRRLFPTPLNCNKYKNYFEKDRYYNRLLRQKLQKLEPAGSSSSNYYNAQNYTSKSKSKNSNAQSLDPSKIRANFKSIPKEIPNSSKYISTGSNLIGVENVSSMGGHANNKRISIRINRGKKGVKKQKSETEKSYESNNFMY